MLLMFSVLTLAIYISSCPVFYLCLCVCVCLCLCMSYAFVTMYGWIVGLPAYMQKPEEDVKYFLLRLSTLFPLSGSLTESAASPSDPSVTPYSALALLLSIQVPMLAQRYPYSHLPGPFKCGLFQINGFLLLSFGNS